MNRELSALASLDLFALHEPECEPDQRRLGLSTGGWPMAVRAVAGVGCIDRIKVLLSPHATRRAAEFSALARYRPGFARFDVMLGELRGRPHLSLSDRKVSGRGTAWGVSVDSMPAPRTPKDGLHRRCLRKGWAVTARNRTAQPGPRMRPPGGWRFCSGRDLSRSVRWPATEGKADRRVAQILIG